MKLKRTVLVIAGTSLLSIPVAMGQHAHGDHGDGNKGHSMEMNHGSMGMDGMKKSKLGKGKKSEFKSKKKHFIVYAEQVPKTPGAAEFIIKIKTADGKPLSKDAKVITHYEMPGMKMDLPDVQLERLSDEEWKVGASLTMAGMWKVHLKIRDQGKQDHIHVKFVTK